MNYAGNLDQPIFMRTLGNILKSSGINSFRSAKVYGFLALMLSMTLMVPVVFWAISIARFF
jgi:hypothetical protein